MNQPDSDDHRLVEPSHRQFMRHIVLSVLLWITYGIYWNVVITRGVEREAALALGLLGLFVVLQVAFTQGWIAHNRSLARRHSGRRQERRTNLPEPVSDFMGRTIRVEPAGTDLTTVPVVVIRVGDTEKRFEAGLALEENVREA